MESVKLQYSCFTSSWLTLAETVGFPMVQYVSTKGGISAVEFDEVVLSGFAEDGGLFVPEFIPRVSDEQLHEWSSLSFTALAFELLSLYIPSSIIPADDLKTLVEKSFHTFESDNVVDLVPLRDDGRLIVMELFHGPTLSFKDMAMGFLVNVLDYLLQKKGEHLSIVLATTGDTGPAAAWASVGKSTVDCWPLYPRGMITEEQERQITTLKADNVFPVGVENCPNGGDDLDAIVARLFEDEKLKQHINLSSVNSINWCRVMVQSVHYFYGYFRAVESVGEKVAFSVPSGAFGNLFGGYLARTMGLPVHCFICANNTNNALHTVLSTGVFARKNLVQTMSSAIDIVAPYNFWRYLYFVLDGDSVRFNQFMEQYQNEGQVLFDSEMLTRMQDGFLSKSVSEPETTHTIKTIFERCCGYLLDPHSAVGVSAALSLENSLPSGIKMICLATAHPAKFPEIVKACLGAGLPLPASATHSSLIQASRVFQELRLCDLEHLENALVDALLFEARK